MLRLTMPGRFINRGEEDALLNAPVEVPINLFAA